jgi:hypothetical protein
MMQLLRWALLVAVGAMLTWAEPAFALLIASDDASATAYNDGWQTNDNGGSGFGAWTLSTGSGASASIGSSGSNINTTGPKSWQLNSSSTTAAAGVRPFNSSLQIGWNFSIDMDTGGFQGTGGTVGFQLRNSTGSNLMEFYAAEGQANYTLNATSVSGTPEPVVTTGLRLTFRLTDANSFILTVDRLANGVGVDNTLTADLLANANQTISGLRIFALDTENGSLRNQFFNSISIVAIPEASSIAFGCLVCSLVGVSYGVRKLRRRQLAGASENAAAFSST